MLTAAQTRTLQFIEDYFSNHQRAPKLLEVAHGIGISSKGTVSRYINVLVEAGYLAKASHRHRGLQLTHNQVALVGKPSPFMQFKQCHSMHIKDDSLNVQGFYAGDTLWYQPGQTAQVGDVIMAYLDKSTPIIKKVHALHGDFMSLSSPHIEDKPRAYAVARIEVYGIIKGWMRNYLTSAAKKEMM
ncbi:MAG: helix-turn-helix domain-containing protein [Legionellales bacterium]